MSSQVVKVARYSALVGGIGYGLMHQRTLQKREDARALDAVKEHQKHMLEEKKRQEDQAIIAAARGGGSGVVSDPESPQFDLEKYLQSLPEK